MRDGRLLENNNTNIYDTNINDTNIELLPYRRTAVGRRRHIVCFPAIHSRLGPPSTPWN